MIRSIIFASVRACQNDNCLKKNQCINSRGRGRLSFKILMMQSSLIFTVSPYIHQLSNKSQKQQLMFHILKAARCPAGFCFHF